ncbi:DUF4262 domain-containing protein [Hymenobacter sp. ASUV-10]|uniref:DUF4262 domain-containing protein n=1 Tax=Hymenobacter aranciens TaxID=3063996 RepID=A0ABT9BDH1_9BACT|nr:DUF4262 domain-containing protein [Hymenobacter sp. ASUV-10]MDO7876316.1 DUF4262 domain-containing protein [Hymenobacter sp. ASUV-10]
MATPEEHAAHDAEAEKQILSAVEEHGFYIAQFRGDGYSPNFAYTIGLFKTYGYPELICFGLDLDLLHSVLWSGKELLDKQPMPDQGIGYPDFIGEYDVRFLTVDKKWYKNYFGYGYWFNGSWDFPALQIVWPDKQALFPWEDDFNPDWKSGQPLLDRNTDFKFREERDLGVYTTRQILEGAPILRVAHDYDGDWQFLCNTTTDSADLKIVALSEVVRRDPSVNKLFQLNYGWSAWRESPEADWETWEQEDDEDSEE